MGSLRRAPARRDPSTLAVATWSVLFAAVCAFEATGLILARPSFPTFTHMVRHVIAWEPARAAAYVLWLASAWVLLPLHERRRHPLRRPALVLAGAAAAVLAIATARATGALSAATVAVPGALLLAYASRRRRIPAIGFGSWLGRLRSWLAAAGHATEAALLSAPPEPAERG